MWQRFLKDYFFFTKKERYGIIVLILVVIFLILSPLLFPILIKEEKFDYSQFETEMAQLRIDSARKYPNKNFGNNYYPDNTYPGKKYQTVKTEVFFFDPNTASVNDWIRLGVKEKTAATIQKYISKGGKFYKPEDIKKIWGLHSSDVERLLPFVRIKNTSNENPPFEKNEYTNNNFSNTPKTIQKVKINLADTTEFIALPGIGSKLSKRIIAFREKLGGFYSIDQVAETYLLPDSTFQKIRPFLVMNDNPVKKININLASVDEMKSHPYIKYNLANAIFQYRKQHGNFNSVDAVKKIMLVTDDIFNKVAPYLAIE